MFDSFRRKSERENLIKRHTSSPTVFSGNFLENENFVGSASNYEDFRTNPIFWLLAIVLQLASKSTSKPRSGQPSKMARNRAGKAQERLTVGESGERPTKGKRRPRIERRLRRVKVSGWLCGREHTAEDASRNAVRFRRGDVGVANGGTDVRVTESLLHERTVRT